MEWRLRTSFGDEVIVAGHCDMRKERVAVRLPSSFLQLELRKWLSGAESSHRRTLVEVFRMLRSELSTWRPTSDGDLLRYVLPELETAFASGALVAFKVSRRPISIEPLPSEEASAGAESRPLDWVEVSVIDEDGEPYLGRYRLDLPDGRSLSGQFNMGGALRADGIPSGSCQLVLPELD